MRGRTRNILVAVLATLAFSGSWVALDSGAMAAAPLAKGDVLLAVGGGTIQQFTPAGGFVQTLDDTTAVSENDGMCFDPSGNLYATNGFVDGSVSKFDSAGNLVAARFISGLTGDPESCVVDALSNIYVGQPDGSGDILKFDSAGNPLDSFAVTAEDRGSDWIDLAADQCTLQYTSEGSTIFRYDGCTHTQLADFATGLPDRCFANRIRPNTEVLVACTGAIVHLSSTGSVINTFSAASLGFGGSPFLFAMNLDPDGTTFWTADYNTGQIVRANIADGSVVKTFDAQPGPNGPYGGLAVVGEITSGQPTTTTTTSPPATLAPTTAPTSATAAVVKPRFTG